MASPGMLYVTMQPRPELSLDQFHEWYNNEHGPTRLRLPHIFSNGFRFRSSDGLEPTFLATYDVTSMPHLETPTYTNLRATRSSREAETIGQVDVQRHFFDLVSTRASPLFLPIEQLTDDEAEGIVLVSVSLTLNDITGAEEAVSKWYEEEHISMLSKVPGWLRTRCFRTSALEGGKLQLVSLHEYTKVNGLGGPEHKASMDTPWRTEVTEKYVKEKTRRTYELFYVFGPAPRELSALSRLPSAAAFQDATMTTVPGPGGAIVSSVSGADGLQIPYILEGNKDAQAPTVAFCNSLLTSLHMWDAFVDILKTARPDLRILRYDTRGRHAIPSPPVPATLDLLSDELASQLSALRIQKLYALIGVSMGGATTLKFALKYPSKLGKFIACDFNVTSSDANTAAWKDRITVAESVDEDGTSPGINKLARVTVERWFHPHTLAEKKDVSQAMVNMVAANDVEGFRYSCQALWDYNLREEMKSGGVPGLLVVGDGDGKGALVKAMDSFKDLVGEKGAELKIVPQAGHLPMNESPREFWEVIKDFL